MTKTVLVVDDSLMMRAVMADIVAADDEFEVVGEANNGAEAVELARNLDPDLILLDIEMPVRDGIDALKRLSLFCRAKVVIVSSTAQVASPQAVEARRLGAAAVVAKPSGALSLDLEAKQGHEILAHKAHGSGAPTRTPTACSDNTSQRAPICRCTHRLI